MRRKKYIKWTDDMIRDEALKYESRFAFQKGSPGAYFNAYKRGILDSISGHMEPLLTYWTDEMLQAEALKYETRGEFAKGSRNAYNACCRRGILHDICSHMGELYVKWTDEMIREEARKYKTRSEFQKGSMDAYCACRRRKILDEVCSHMEGIPYIKWTNEMLQEEAMKYKTRNEFFKGSRSAYDACLRRGILDDVCSHMQEPLHWDKPHCVYLIEIFTTNDELNYYVGQTSKLEDRLYIHFHQGISDSPVSTFLSKTPIKYKKHYIVKDNLTYKESLELESETIRDLKDRGMNLLNKDLYIL